MVESTALILSVGLNLLLILTLWGMYRKNKREQESDRKKSIVVGQAIAYREVLNSINKMVGDN